MNSKRKTVVTVVKPFQAPSYDADIVVFSDETPYYGDESAIEHIYHCVKYSKEHHIYTVSCRFEKDFYLMQCVISPEGKIIGVQGATHLNLSYRGKFNNYSEINVFDTPIGKFFIAVDSDIFHPEVARIATSKGADFIIASRFMNLINDSNYRACVGSENASASNGIYVLDVTEFGARFITPFQNNCIRKSKIEPKFDKKYYIDFEMLKKENIFNMLNSNKLIFQKYIDILER